MYFFVISLMALALNPNDFINDYKLISGDADCAQKIEIEHRKDWKGKPFIGLEEKVVGRGLQCSFKGINMGIFVHVGRCPTAGPLIPGCKMRTEDTSTSSGSKMTWKFSETKKIYGRLDSKFESKCELQLVGKRLEYKRSIRSWQKHQRTKTDSYSCVYFVK